MAILELLSQIPLMFYFSAILLPAALYAFLTVSKPKKTVAALAANPADQLKEKKINVKKEFTSSLLLALIVAFGAAIIISIGDIIGDYKNDAGIFAKIMPPASFPPAPGYVFPPAPEIIK